MQYSLAQLPEELFLSHIFEYLLGPVSQYKKDVEDWVFKKRLDDEIKYKFVVTLDNLRGLNSLGCVCKDLRKLFLSENSWNEGETRKLTIIGQFWLNISNLIELTNYCTRYQDYSSMTLTKGDLHQDDAWTMARIQMALENVEMGIQSKAQDIASECSYADILSEMIDWESKTNMRDIETSFEERINHMITSTSNYFKLYSKTGISVYELFVYKAHIMCLGMVPNFDSEKDVKSYYGFGRVEDHTLLSLELCSKGGGYIGLLSDEIEEKEIDIYKNYLSITFVTQWSILSSASFSNSLQYLSLVIRSNERLDYTDMLSNCYFPNLKFLSVAIEDEEELLRYNQEIYQLLEQKVLQGIKKASFPKIIHLSLKRFFDYESISKIEILDQLLCLEIISGFFGYNNEQHNVWNTGSVMNMLNSTYFNEITDNCIQLLIIYSSIQSRWIDADIDLIEEFYDKCREKHFAGSISHSAVLEFYSNCWE